MFVNKGFSPVHVNAGPLAPRIFSYFNPDELLDEILKPGYFNSKKLIMRPQSFIKVVCKNAIVELIVKTNVGDLTMHDEFIRAVDPYKESIKQGSKGGHNKGTGKGRQPRKKASQKLPKTG